jgi:hypothetical protein
MKAITIHQPYAELIARGDKQIENRTWRTHHEGPLAIHAAGLTSQRHRELAAEFGVDLERVPLGAIVAVAQRIECVKISDVPRLLRRSQGVHAFGPWCWILHEVRRLDQPLAIAGKQSLWNVPAAIAAQLCDQPV